MYVLIPFLILEFLYYLYHYCTNHYWKLLPCTLLFARSELFIETDFVNVSFFTEFLQIFIDFYKKIRHAFLIRCTYVNDQ